MYFVFACFTMCESHCCVIIMFQPYLMQTELAAMDPFMQVTFFFLANVFLMLGPMLDSFRVQKYKIRTVNSKEYGR